MKKLSAIAIVLLGLAPARAEDLSEGFRFVEVASVSDAIEQLYGNQGIYVPRHAPVLCRRKFAGPAVTCLFSKEEHHEGRRRSRECSMPSMKLRPAPFT